MKSLALRGIVLVAIAVLLGSCTVNKADLARQVDLQDVDFSKVPDGVYTGSYTIRPPAGAMAGNKSVEVKVTVAAGKLTGIDLVKPPQLGKSASYARLFSRVKETQHLSPDAITSATITSMSILKAIQVALSAPAAGSSQ
jgi:uncharacterized protein with FMN-binding domain